MQRILIGKMSGVLDFITIFLQTLSRVDEEIKEFLDLGSWMFIQFNIKSSLVIQINETVENEGWSKKLSCLTKDSLAVVIWKLDREFPQRSKIWGIPEGEDEINVFLGYFRIDHQKYFVYIEREEGNEIHLHVKHKDEFVEKIGPKYRFITFNNIS